MWAQWEKHQWHVVANMLRVGSEPPMTFITTLNWFCDVCTASPRRNAPNSKEASGKMQHQKGAGAQTCLARAPPQASRAFALRLIQLGGKHSAFRGSRLPGERACSAQQGCTRPFQLIQ